MVGRREQWQGVSAGGLLVSLGKAATEGAELAEGAQEQLSKLSELLWFLCRTWGCLEPPVNVDFIAGKAGR